MTAVLPESARFTVLIPARLGSTRLPRKALADIAGVPMVVRVAQQAQKSQAGRTVVACDSPEIMACCAHWGIAALLTDSQHASGSDRLAQASQMLQLADDEIVVNVQGDEPLIAPTLIDAVAQVLQARSDCVMGTAAHALNSPAEFHSPHVVKVVLDAQQRALYFSRAPIPATRDAAPSTSPQAVPAEALRHVGIYSYRAGFLRQFPQLPAAPLEQQESLEQLRVLWHGYRIAVHVSAQTPGAGVDTPEDLERVRQGFARL